MTVLGLDTATPATVAGLLRDDGVAFEARHDPGPDERPGHATRLLGLVDEVLAAAGCEMGDVGRIAVGVGPGSFTGLRIGIATARGLAQATGAELVSVSTLRALALNAPERDRTTVAAIDARRGEVFAAAWTGDTEVMAPTALAPEDLAARLRELAPPAGPPLAGGAPPALPPLALGDGAVRFRAHLQPAGAAIPPDGDELHRIAARHVCRLGAGATPAGIGAVVPHYIRAPDARPRQA
ncbi:MAG TPA: tRNA (adenosine(37)-N6)-threonylcarbamoyltransferase complex dimerization subunit type 1 TsaB [Solirubrobacteraceae bacterium]|nr:tRNA (adenosine(37)-N6)-threonylcarbamoyltransferase complex dimerization subunit type 1 TsaB [Solirubrobacteraceae bacterium]